MPNHVINEVVFDGVDDSTQERIIAAACNAKGEIDFGVLLPIPLNCWMGSVGSEHKKTFPDNALEWCAKNWSTKWGPYGDPITIRAKSSVTFQFQTAWCPPYGWLCAMFNHLRLPFRYAWFSDGESNAYAGSFNPETLGQCFSDAWIEKKAPEQNDRLGVMLWGEESWANIKAESAQ